jgi:hypothetical protein
MPASPPVTDAADPQEATALLTGGHPRGPTGVFTAPPPQSSTPLTPEGSFPAMSPANASASLSAITAPAITIAAFCAVIALLSWITGGTARRHLTPTAAGTAAFALIIGLSTSSLPGYLAAFLTTTLR